jgi:hypothetical protein
MVFVATFAIFATLGIFVGTLRLGRSHAKPASASRA